MGLTSWPRHPEAAQSVGMGRKPRAAWGWRQRSAGGSARPLGFACLPQSEARYPVGFCFCFSWLRFGSPWLSKVFDSLCVSRPLGTFSRPAPSAGETAFILTASPPPLCSSTVKSSVCSRLCRESRTWKCGVVAAEWESPPQEPPETARS